VDLELSILFKKLEFSFLKWNGPKIRFTISPFVKVPRPAIGHKNEKVLSRALQKKRGFNYVCYYPLHLTLLPYYIRGSFTISATNPLH